MFSSRLRWDASPNPLTTLLEEKRRDGIDVLDLTVSNPTGLFRYPSAAIRRALSDERVMRYEPSARGSMEAREAVAAYYAKRGVRIATDRVLLTASTSEAYAYLFKLLADPGEEVLVPRPSYPLFEYLAALESVRVAQYPLRYDGAWHVDFAALEQAITPRTSAIIVVNPNNPTGSVLAAEEHARLDALAASHGIAIVSDEVFADYRFRGEHSTLIGDRRALTFSLNGLSKAAGLPQMKLGWIVASGPGHESALARLEWIADTYLSVSAPVQAAAPRLLDAAEKIQAQIRKRTSTNFAALQAALAGSAFHVLNSSGGWNAIIQAPRTRSEEQWALELLREQNVLVQPGFFYDFESEAYLIVSLLLPRVDLEKGVRRLLIL